ncbi:TolC family protein [Sphingobacterium sp. E70]|uniref:TolC family protein n=1 Tax=Sphingobacterium sp. E70 TaxID=2853439 RepID=UPI00211BB1D8|nr:TolC family protein [Sphingobacterium sp. E70]
MNRNRLYQYTGFALFLLSFVGCKPLEIQQRAENRAVPEKYGTAENDSTNTGKIKWNSYFNDPNLQGLIGLALANNQELHIVLQEIEMAKNEVSAKKGEYLPSVGLKVGAGVDKVSRYTNIGAMEKIRKSNLAGRCPNRCLILVSVYRRNGKRISGVNCTMPPKRNCSGILRVWKAKTLW